MTPIPEERLAAILADTEDPSPELLAELVRVYRLYQASKARRFPVLDPPAGCPGRVPWSLLEDHEQQALRNHDQTLERLAQRGGLGVEELVAVVRNERWTKRTFKTEQAATAELLRLLATPEPGGDAKEAK